MDFHKTHSIEIRFVIGPEIYCSQDVCVHFSAGKFYGLGKKGLKAPETMTIGNKLNIEIKTTKTPGPE